MSDSAPRNDTPTGSEGPRPDDPLRDAADPDDEAGEAPWWMKAVMAGLPFLILAALLLLDRCRTGF